MKGKVRIVKGKMQLQLIPENNQDKKWMLNAFYCIQSGVLESDEGNIESFVIWTDNNYKLPRKHKVSCVQKDSDSQ